MLSAVATIALLLAGLCMPQPSAAAPRAPSAKVLDTVPIAGGVRGAKRTHWRLGPFLLAPAPLGTAHFSLVIPASAKPCEACFITRMEPHLVYADGTRADMDHGGVILHHLVAYDTLRSDPTDPPCGVHMLRPELASGDERTPLEVPAGYGFLIAPDPWTAIAELMNTSRVHREVYFDAYVDHVPATTPGIKPVVPVALNIAPCTNSEYSVPAGRSTATARWISTITGRIVAAGGHMHAGGVGVVLTNTSTGRRICSSRARYGTDDGAIGPMANMLTSMSTCEWDSLGTVVAGQTLEISSIYDTPRPLSGVMGIIGMAIYETTDLTGGTPAPARMRATPGTKVPAGITDEHS